MIPTFTSLIKNYFSSYSGLSKACWQGLFISFIESILSSIFYFLSLYFVNILHIDINTAGNIIACHGMGAIIGGLAGGKLSDKLSPGIVSILSLLSLALSYLILIKLKSTHLVMLDMFTIGIAAYAFLTSNHVWILNQCSDSAAERLKALNILATLSNLGISVAAVIVALFVHYGFQYLFLVASVCFSLCAGYLFLYEWKCIKPVSLNQSNELTAENQDSLPSNKIIGLVLICVLLAGSVVAQLISTYSIFIQRTFPQLGIKAVSILFIINSLMVVFCQTPFVNFFRNYNKILMIGVGAFLIGIGMSILGLPSALALAIISCGIYTMGEMIFFPMAQFVCYQKGAKKKKGYSLGVFRTTYAASRVLGPAVGGAIYHQWGGETLWGLCGIVGVLCFTACLYYKEQV